MNKPKFSLKKAVRTVEISSRIEGHKIPNSKSLPKKRSNNKVKY